MYKKLRAVKSATAEPPAGYHYEGQPARMIDGKDDFKDDLVDDYLKLAQLLDPRVCNRTRPYTPSEIDRLLQLLLKYLPATDGE
jgi:hypothetical protein